MNRLMIGFLFLIIVACHATQSAFRPVESDVAKVSTTDSTITLVDLKKGFNLYVTNCGGCHSLPLPSSKNKSSWEAIWPEMFSKTELNPVHQQLVKQYVYSKL